jgi:hypothetical protein
MVKTVVFEETFNVSIKTLCDAIFLDNSFQRKFHERQKDTTNDIKVNFEGWTPVDKSEKEFTRTVTFDTPINAPAMITSMMRLGPSITCKLQDHLKWLDDSHFQVHSKLYFLEVPTIGKDTVKVDINYDAKRVTPSRTHLVLSITCEFTTRIWGLTGIAESYMEKDAQKSFEDWLDLAEQHLRDYQRESEREEQEEAEEEQTLLHKSISEENMTTASSISSTSYQSVQSEQLEEEFEEKQEKSISNLLQRSYTLASLKRDLREVRALVSKTEVRVQLLEEECSNHQLDLTVSRYMQRVEQLFNQQSVERDLARDRLIQTQAFIEAVMARYKHTSALWWFCTGSAITMLFTVVIPLCVWYYSKILKTRRR